MDRDALQMEVDRLTHAATLAVQRHAALYAPDVAPALVEALCAALGEISVHEAILELNKLQGEATP